MPSLCTQMSELEQGSCFRGSAPFTPQLTAVLIQGTEGHCTRHSLGDVLGCRLCSRAVQAEAEALLQG